jgi:hypothetical protein
VNSELSVLRIQYGKQAEFVNELENKLSEAEKKNREQKHQQERAGTPDSSNYYDYSRPRSTRLPRTSTNGTLSNSSNPVKMVQEMVGRVRVSTI